jgi:hypothetical protein
LSEQSNVKSIRPSQKSQLCHNDIRLPAAQFPKQSSAYTATNCDLNCFYRDSYIQHKWSLPKREGNNRGTGGGRGGPVRRRGRARGGQAASAPWEVAGTRPSPETTGAAWTLARIGSSGKRPHWDGNLEEMRGGVRTGVDERDKEEEEQRAEGDGADSGPQCRHEAGGTAAAEGLFSSAAEGK